MKTFQKMLFVLGFVTSLLFLIAGLIGFFIVNMESILKVLFTMMFFGITAIIFFAIATFLAFKKEE